MAEVKIQQVEGGFDAFYDDNHSYRAFAPTEQEARDRLAAMGGQPAANAPGSFSQVVTATVDPVKYREFEETALNGRKISVSAWRESKPHVQGTGLSRREALANLLRVESDEQKPAGTQ